MSKKKTPSWFVDKHLNHIPLNRTARRMIKKQTGTMPKAVIFPVRNEK